MRSPGRAEGEQAAKERAQPWRKAALIAVLAAVTVVCAQVLVERAGGDYQAIAGPADNGGPPNSERVRAWFERYDAIRRSAQMTPEERKIADGLLAKKITLLLPGFGRFAAQRLLKKQIERYEAAECAMKELPPTPETRELHEGYTRYFTTSKALFHDTLRALNNPLHSKKELGERKAKTAELDETLKATDKQLRDTYNIAPYSYRTEESS